MRSNQLTLALGLAFVLGACGGGGSGSGATSGTVDLLMRDAPTDELSSFRASLTSLVLVKADDSTTDDLLAGPVTVDLIGLQVDHAWLARTDVSRGTYKGLEVTLDPLSIEARDLAGADVPINVISSTLAIDFASPVVVAGDDYTAFSIDFDLDNSLTGTVDAPPLDFAPVGLAVGDDGSDSHSIDELRGVIGSADELAGTFVMHGYVDDDLSLDLGNLTVAVDGSTLFVDDDGATLDSAGFFAAVVAGSTLVEVHGVLSGETLAADRIEVEDHSGGSSVASQVKIEGVLTDLQIGGGTLLVLDVKKGEEDAELILGVLGDPDSIEISFDNTTIVIDDDTVGDSSALVVGQRLVVSFPTFTGEPFFASKIDLKSEAQYEGVLTDVDAPGEAATATLDDDDLAIATGLVDDDTTEVAIDLTGSTFELDTDGHPALTIDDLVVGLKVELEGTFGGSSSSPTFAATKLKVHAGEAEGTVDLVDSDLRLFMASIAEVDDPWGDVDPDSLSTFFLTDSVVFTGDVSTEQEFFDAFAALGTGETLEVEVQGLVTDSLNYYFDVYEVKVELASN